MLKQLGGLIEKKPWLVVGIVLLVTIGFGTLLPSLEMNTDFEDFMPDDEVVQANERITEYFGQNQQSLLLFVEKQKTSSTLSIPALKEQQYIIDKLLEIPGVESASSVIFFIDQVCQMEFGKTFRNCTEKEIKIAINDLMNEKISKTLNVLDEPDPNEQVDYKRQSIFSRGKSKDNIDIKNCEIKYDNDTITFSLEVYDLSSFKEKITSPVLSANVFEWYVDFENLVKPDERLDISYKIAAHIEPKNTIWSIGDGPFKNVKNIFSSIKNRELFNIYDQMIVLWVQMPGSPMSFPIKLSQSNLSFNIDQNIIEMSVSREELSKFGIAPRFGQFELPAKLSNMQLGTRYYQTPLVKLPWFRISSNTSFLFKKIDKIQDRPLLGSLVERSMNRYADISWEDFDTFLDMDSGVISIPDQIALKDLDSLWIDLDSAPDNEPSDSVLFLRPEMYNDLRLGAKGFISVDYDETGSSSASLIFLKLNVSASGMGHGGSDYLLDLTEATINRLNEVDNIYDYISVEATGDSVISLEMNQVTADANQIIMPMIFVVIIAVLYISFRKPSYIVIPLISLGIASIWLFGSMVLLGIAFNTIAVALIPIIMGLGVDYSVHLAHNYRFELSKGKTPAEAIKKSVLEIGTAMFLAMLTTVIAFLSFLTASIPPIRDFGILLALGIVYTFITAITFHAAVRYILDRKKESFTNGKKHVVKLDEVMKSFAGKILLHQKKIIATIIIITVFFSFGAVQLRTVFNFESFVPEDNSAIQLFSEIEENFPFAGQEQEYVLFEGEIATVDMLEGLRLTHENMQDDTFIRERSDGSANTVSIYTIIQNAVENNETLVTLFNVDKTTGIPKSDSDVKRLFDYLYENEEYGVSTQNNLHMSEDGVYDAALIRIFVDFYQQSEETVDLGETVSILTDELNEDLGDYGDVDFIATGTYIITNSINENLTQSQVLSTFLSFILAIIVLIIAYRNPALGIISIIPVMVSMVWILGTMNMIGYTLNMMTITVTSVTIGIGIDYAIHVTERFRLVADKTGDIKKALCETISTTGGALLIAAVSTTLGFIVLIFAPIPPMVQFGVILAMTITYSFITSVLILPLILAKWAEIRKKRKGYIISNNKYDEDKKNDYLSCEK